MAEKEVSPAKNDQAVSQGSALVAEKPAIDKPVSGGEKVVAIPAKEDAKKPVDAAKSIKTESAKKASIVDNLREKLFGAKKTSASATSESGKAQQGEVLTPQERKEVLDAEKLYNDGLASIRDLISPASFEVAYDHMRVEGFYAQSYFVYAYPRYLDTNWLSPIVNFDVTMDISQFIYPINSAEIMKVLR